MGRGGCVFTSPICTIMQDMAFKDFIAKHRQRIVDELEIFRKQHSSQHLNSLSQECLRDIFDFTLKGKMLRGLFVILSHEMFGGTYEGAAAQVGASLELNQSGLLIHDDIMDNDEIRPGTKIAPTAAEG